MEKISAGLLMYRKTDGKIEFFIVHPGGPFWKNKEQGVWSIPKGLVNKGEDLLECAKREFKEETGIDSEGPYIPLGETKLKSGKTVYAWAFRGDWKGKIISNLVKTRWPLNSENFIEVPEIDKGGFFSKEECRHKLNASQFLFIERLEEFLKT